MFASAKPMRSGLDEVGDLGLRGLRLARVDARRMQAESGVELCHHAAMWNQP